MNMPGTKTVVRKVTPAEKLVIDLPAGGTIEITFARTAIPAVKMPLEYVWREERREPNLSGSK